MILGIGSDLIDIRRMEKIMGRYEERFIARCFTDEECAKAERRWPVALILPLMPSALPPRKPCPRRWALDLPKAFT